MAKESNTNTRLEQAFQRAFDKVFRIFGEATKETLLAFLKESHYLDRSEFMKKPDLFEEGLNMAFRTGGGSMIKLMLLKELYAQLDLLRYDGGDWSLSRHIENLRTRLESQNENAGMRPHWGVKEAWLEP